MSQRPSLTVMSGREIIEQFWSVTSISSNLPQHDSEDGAYFEYFEIQCQLARQYDDPENQLCTQRTICDIVSQFKEGEPRHKIISDLSLKVNGILKGNEEQIRNAIDLAARLWLMVHIGNMPRGVTGQTALLWNEGSLKECVSAHFQHRHILTDMVTFEKTFNARNVERIADVIIRWTPNLIDHLRLIEDGKKPVLNIFYHASFLNHHHDADFFPAGFVHETLRTLALLLPAHDRDTRKWYKKQHAKLGLDLAALKCGQLKLEERQIGHFNFWHDRLVVLKQYFDDSRPRTVKQWWFDDRKRVQWFWVAILLVFCTILFGFIQCIEGGWQIWMAYHPRG